MVMDGSMNFCCIKLEENYLENDEVWIEAVIYQSHAYWEIHLAYLLVWEFSSLAGQEEGAQKSQDN